MHVSFGWQRGYKTNLLKMASPSSSRLVKVIKGALRASPDAARLWQKVNEEIESANLQGPDQMDVVLSDSEIYPQSFMSVLEYAIFPRARRPNFAASFGIENRDSAWGWTTDEIKRNVMDDTWAQAPSLSNVATIFARTFALMGKCRFPLYISQSQAGD